jgi:hypothetical protein
VFNKLQPLPDTYAEVEDSGNLAALSGSDLLDSSGRQRWKTVKN